MSTGSLAALAGISQNSQVRCSWGRRWKD